MEKIDKLINFIDKNKTDKLHRFLKKNPSLKKDLLIKLIREGDVDRLRFYLNENPELLNRPFDGFGSDGYALHCAAHYNQPKIIRFLVEEKSRYIDQKEGVGGEWTPLCEAVHRNSYKAVACLLNLGTDLSLSKHYNGDIERFCRKMEVQSLLSPEYLEKQRQREEQKKKEEAEREERERKEEAEREERERKEAAEREERERKEAIEKREADIKGTWVKTTSQEVVHDYKQPEQKFRLIDTFNFETRLCRFVVKDLSDGHLTQETIFFDNVADVTLLKQAFDKLKDLGGEANENLIQKRSLAGKRSLSGKRALGDKKMKV